MRAGSHPGAAGAGFRIGRTAVIKEPESMKQILSCILLIAAAHAADAQLTSQLDRILLPERPAIVQGSFGSKWMTDVAIANTSDTPLQVNGYAQPGGCPVLCVRR
jgi:hypothetical protein